MSQPRKLHLFNCDRTYKLDAVEDLLNGMKVKLGFESVERHYFSLSQMSEMSTKTIPKLQMDLAFFVVHAHESRLSINEDNAGIGYAKIYQALLNATGRNVIIVIGGDDSYKNEDEEDQVVISRWARRKISSQFNEEFLDGRKSFIFSWNKKHREIHKEALLHYFDPSKKGQKFEYQPKPKPKQAGSQPSGQRGPLQKTQSMSEQSRTAYGSPLQKTHSMSEQSRTAYGSPLQKTQSMSEQSRTAYGSALQKTQPVNEQRITDSSLSSPFNSAEQRREDSSGSNISTAMANTAPFASEQGARPKEVPPSSTGRTELKDLAILGCNVSNDSMQTVKKVMRDIGRKLNLSESPTQNLQPVEVKRYLTRNHLKYCVLVVDADTVKDAYENLPQRRVEYEKLLETAANEVEKKVIILICDDCSLPPKDETIVNESIERIFNQGQKGFTAWLKNGKLAVDADVLVQFLISASPVPQTNPQISQSPPVVPDLTADSQGFHTRNPEKSGTSHGCENAQAMQPALQGAEPIPSPAIINTVVTGEIVKLKSMLRYGEISRQSEDLQIWDPKFIVPDYISKSLHQKHSGTPVAGVKIVLGVNGQLSSSVDPKLKELSWRKGLQIAANETLMLKTRLRYGLVSFQENDVDFRFGDWEIPRYIVDSLKQEYLETACADLCIISDRKENLGCTVKIGKKDRVFNFAKETLIFTNLTQKKNPDNVIV